MRSLLAPLALLSLLAGCTHPRPSDYVGGAAGLGMTGIGLGKNASGENCSQMLGDAPDTVAVFCGTWHQPAARIHTDSAPGSTKLMSVATSGPWRTTVDLRFACDAPRATSILGGDPALVLQCRRRIGGWPQVAMVTLIDGK